MKRYLIIIFVLLLSAVAMSQNTKKVAVYVTGDNADVNKVLGSKLVTAIARSEEYSAIERTAAFLAELNKEQVYQRTGAVDDSELSRLGKQFGVQYVCVAAVSEIFNEKYISARLIDVETAQIERSASYNGNIQSLENLVSAANCLTRDLLSALKKKQSDIKKVAVYVVKNDASKNIGKVLGDKLVTGITQSGRYIAIERTNSFLSQLGKEQKYQREGAVDDSEIANLGKQFGVSYVCVADVSDVFGEKFVSARMIDVETAEVVNSYDVGGTMNDMNGCLKIANGIASELSKGTFEEQALEKAKIDRAKKIEEEEWERKRQENTVDGIYRYYVDLGLPSGTLWEDGSGGHKGRHRYLEAKKTFWKHLPTLEQVQELLKYCYIDGADSRVGGYCFVGPNGNKIYVGHSRYSWYNCDGLNGRYPIRDSDKILYVPVEGKCCIEKVGKYKDCYFPLILVK